LHHFTNKTLKHQHFVKLTPPNSNNLFSINYIKHQSPTNNNICKIFSTNTIILHHFTNKTPKHQHFTKLTSPNSTPHYNKSPTLHQNNMFKCHKINSKESPKPKNTTNSPIIFLNCFYFLEFFCTNQFSGIFFHSWISESFLSALDFEKKSIYNQSSYVAPTGCICSTDTL
jgi:hypothetical protein